MFTICFSNEKGGVGKTTISTNVAYLAAMEGAKVLFIDNDRQGNASDFFGVDMDNSITIAELLMGEATADEVIQKTRYENIDIIPADQSLADADAMLLIKKQGNAFKRAIQPIAFRYNLCIIDNPPDHEKHSVLNVLNLADEVIIVSPPTRFGMAGIKVMLKTILDMQHFNPKLQLAGVLLNSFKPNSTGFRFIDQLHEMKLPVFANKLRHTEGYLDSAVEVRQSIYEFAPRCGFAMDLKKWFYPFINREASYV